MDKSVAAVVVTFNRKTLLVECLTALLNQSQSLQRIYVIDQASTDGTREFLRERGFLDNVTIEYTLEPVNTGGAGGFCHGMEMAYRNGHSWIWIMDDDAIPDRDACERMVPFLVHETVAAVANNKLKADRTCDTRHIVVRQSESARGYCCLQFSSFVGLLVSRAAIERVGFPKPELFFQYDDNEYCARLLTFGDIAYASESNIVHREAGLLRVKRRFAGLSWDRLPDAQYWRVYFAYRNNLWRLIHCPGPRDHCALLRYLASVIKEVPFILLLDRSQPRYRFRLLCRAIYDACRERFDNEFAFTVRDCMIANHRRA